MSQTDFLPDFPSHLTASAMREKQEVEMREYAIDLFERCLEEIAKNEFPCRVLIPDVELAGNNQHKAIEMVKAKISNQGSYTVENKSERDRDTYEDVLVISMV